MSRKPIIMHLILDGYSPVNYDNFYDNFKDIIPQEYQHESFSRDVDISEGKLRSPNQWTKCYSKTSFEEIHQEGDSGRLGVSTKIARVPAENFLWNKLAKKSINSWIYPYGQYYKVIERNLLDPEYSEYVSGLLKMYGTRLSCKLDSGKKTFYKSPLSVYYGFHEASWNRESKHTDVFNDYRDLWKHPTKEFLEKLPKEVHDYYMEKLSEYQAADTILFNEEIFPHLEEFINKGLLEDGGYVHIGLVETDTPYHFVPEYPDIVKNVREYVRFVITRAIDMVDPDTIIITGDHSMAPVTLEDFPGAHLIDYSEHSGNKRYGAQSSWGITPILTEHGHSVGAMIYTKSSDVIQNFSENYYGKDKYLMYDIYNFIHECY